MLEHQLSHISGPRCALGLALSVRSHRTMQSHTFDPKNSLNFLYSPPHSGFAQSETGGGAQTGGWGRAGAAYRARNSRFQGAMVYMY